MPSPWSTILGLTDPRSGGVSKKLGIDKSTKISRELMTGLFQPFDSGTSSWASMARQVQSIPGLSRARLPALPSEITNGSLHSNRLPLLLSPSSGPGPTSAPLVAAQTYVASFPQLRRLLQRLEKAIVPGNGTKLGLAELVMVQTLTRAVTYFKVTVPPASSRAAFAFSAVSLLAPSSTIPGAPSTRALASPKPRLVRARTSLMT